MSDSARKESKLDKNNPFAGLRPFDESDREYFLGRSQEINDLFWRVHKNNTTICFGRSGLGKTSLMLAGLFPRLRAKQYFPIYIRCGYGAGNPPLCRQVLLQAAVAGHEANITVPDFKEEESLWEYFHRCEFWTASFEMLTPVLVFDQFEELFTLTDINDPHRTEFVEELSNLMENRIPKADAKRLGDMDEPPFSFDSQPYRVVLSLREDFLPDLENLRSKIPSVGRNRMRLLPMNGQSAIEVVTQVEDLASSDIAKRIVRWVANNKDPNLDLVNLKVEPALLSTFCRELNKDRIELGLDSFTSALLDDRGEKILDDFYDDALNGYPNQESVRLLIEEQLLTDSGRRIPIAMEDVVNKDNDIDESCIDQLIDDRLIRRYERDDVVLLELTHDLLTKAIADSRDRRRNLEAEQEIEAAKLEQERIAAESKSKLAKQRRQTILWAALALVSIVLMWFAYEQKVKAEAATEKAETATGRADTQAEIARDAEQRATQALKKSSEAQDSAKDLQAQLRRLDEALGPVLTTLKIKIPKRDEIREILKKTEAASAGFEQAERDANEAALDSADWQVKVASAEKLLARTNSDGDIQQHPGGALEKAKGILAIRDLVDPTKSMRIAAYRQLRQSIAGQAVIKTLLEALSEQTFFKIADTPERATNARFMVLKILGETKLSFWKKGEISQAVLVLLPEHAPSFNECDNKIHCPALGKNSKTQLKTTQAVISLATINLEDREFRQKILREYGPLAPNDKIIVEEMITRLLDGQFSAVGRDLALTYLLEDVNESFWREYPKLVQKTREYNQRANTFGPLAKAKAKQLESKLPR
jgi:hypothetical protein